MYCIGFYFRKFYVLNIVYVFFDDLVLLLGFNFEMYWRISRYGKLVCICVDLWMDVFWNLFYK